MPGFDGTGPQGFGPRTGGGRGFCASYAPPPQYGWNAAPGTPYGAYGYGPARGAGRGGMPWGGGRGRAYGGGRGRGYGAGRFAGPYAYGGYGYPNPYGWGPRW